jgi:hypothetical protein
MKKILVVQYSQSGQLSEVLRHFTAPLAEAEGITLTVETIRPKQPYPFPWPILRFFDTFPETVYLDAPEIEPLSVDPGEPFDLVIIGYQAWFLSPSLPMTAFLKSEVAARLLKDRPVVTVVACRDMWLMAQEQVKALLAQVGARLVGHVALVDGAGTVGSFLATPVWVMSGHKGPHLGGLIPRAGVDPAQIEASRRFGQRIASVLASGAAIDDTLLQHLQAVKVNQGLISSEKAIRRGLLLWGKLLRSLGRQGSFQRKPVLLLYICWLVLAILLLVPLGFLLKKILAPLLREKMQRETDYFGAPSGF